MIISSDFRMDQCRDDNWEDASLFMIDTLSNYDLETVQVQEENPEEKSPSSTSPTSIIPQTLVKSANWIGQTSLSLSNQILPAGVSSGTAQKKSYFILEMVGSDIERLWILKDNWNLYWFDIDWIWRHSKKEIQSRSDPTFSEIESKMKRLGSGPPLIVPNGVLWTIQSDIIDNFYNCVWSINNYFNCWQTHYINYQSRNVFQKF